MDRVIHIYLDGRLVHLGAFQGDDVGDLIMHACVMLLRWDLWNNCGVMKNWEVVEDYDELLDHDAIYALSKLLDVSF